MAGNPSGSVTNVTADGEIPCADARVSGASVEASARTRNRAPAAWTAR
jgi:hypothetical protein